MHSAVVFRDCRKLEKVRKRRDEARKALASSQEGKTLYRARSHVDAIKANGRPRLWWRACDARRFWSSRLERLEAELTRGRALAENYSQNDEPTSPLLSGSSFEAEPKKWQTGRSAWRIRRRAASSAR